jgi:hypothetical protein
MRVAEKLDGKGLGVMFLGNSHGSKTFCVLRVRVAEVVQSV